tara:strand:+ start:80 stop:205 length:126 start_codon:yes stop_codon:yes gene_type:complete
MVGSKINLGGFVNVSPLDFIDNINNQIIGSKVKQTAKKLTK